MKMVFTPEMIDAMTVQLKSAFDLAKLDTANTIPENVLTTGNAFVQSLDAWSDELKKKAA